MSATLRVIDPDPPFIEHVTVSGASVGDVVAYFDAGRVPRTVWQDSSGTTLGVDVKQDPYSGISGSTYGADLLQGSLYTGTDDDITGWRVWHGLTSWFPAWHAGNSSTRRIDALRIGHPDRAVSSDWPGLFAGYNSGPGPSYVPPNPLNLYPYTPSKVGVYVEAGKVLLYGSYPFTNAPASSSAVEMLSSWAGYNVGCDVDVIGNITTEGSFYPPLPHGINVNSCDSRGVLRKPLCRVGWGQNGILHIDPAWVNGWGQLGLSSLDNTRSVSDGYCTGRIPASAFSDGQYAYQYYNSTLSLIYGANGSVYKYDFGSDNTDYMFGDFLAMVLKYGIPLSDTMEMDSDGMMGYYVTSYRAAQNSYYTDLNTPDLRGWYHWLLYWKPGADNTIWTPAIKLISGRTY